MKVEFSFYQVIEKLEQVTPASENYHQAQVLLEEVKQYPFLRDGITDPAQIADNADLISRLLVDYFPPSLTLNEIKAVNFPYSSMFINSTERFKNILRAAGPDFQVNIRDFDEHRLYVLMCCIILNDIYGTRLDFTSPMFYDIPTKDGVIKHYRILYNADFMDVLPTEKSIPLTQADIDLLLNNYDDLALWKEKFPPESWLLKGFTIITLFDATVENAVSLFKEKLLGLNSTGFQENIESIFQSIYQISDIKVGFTIYNQEEDTLLSQIFGQRIQSYILQDNQQERAVDLLCAQSYQNLIQYKGYFAVSNTEEFLVNNPKSKMAQRLIPKNIKSFILAPVVKNDHLLGILEVVASRAKELNSINANKLDVIMPFLTDTVERLIAQAQNEVQAIIQTNYTSIHSSVYWKFREEALRYVRGHRFGNDYALQEIVFPDVYPLYGQIDIKGSSEARNSSVQNDLQEQLNALLVILQSIKDMGKNRSFEEAQQRINDYLTDISLPIKASTEQYIVNYLESHVHPFLKEINHPRLETAIQQYFIDNNKDTGAFHIYRRKYEKTITTINNKMAKLIDNRQTEAQAIFPHYYERFKTDGIDHNLYIGASIHPKQTFNLKKLHALRLWQLRVLCEMELTQHHLKPNLPYPLDVTTLVLVYQSTMSIRFRMDEKRFDVDGSYNARFEIIKKRIDKAHIKDTDERITQTGMITIVYSNDVEEEEYLGYIHSLQAENILKENIEKIDIEPLQGVSGLKALRIGIVH